MDHGILEMATGSGKTLTALGCLKVKINQESSVNNSYSMSFSSTY